MGLVYCCNEVDILMYFLLTYQGKDHLRGSVHEVLKRREKREDPVWNELEVAMSHVVHEVDVSNINSIGCD